MLEFRCLSLLESSEALVRWLKGSRLVQGDMLSRRVRFAIKVAALLLILESIEVNQA